MESNVICLNSFKEVINERRARVEGEAVGSQGEALAIEHQSEPCSMVVKVKEKIFEKMPEYRFVVSDGFFPSDIPDEDFTWEVRIKGTEISAHGYSEDSAWLKMSGVLLDEGLI